MNNLIKDIFIGVITSGIVCACLAFVIRQTMKGWIDTMFLRHLEQFKHENQKQLEELKHKNDVKLTQIEAQLDCLGHKAMLADKQRLSGFKEFATHIYHCKKHLQQIVDKLNNMENATEEERKKTFPEMFADVSTLYETYSEHFSRIILFIEKSLFDKLHRYKKIMEGIRDHLMVLQEDSNKFNTYKKSINDLASVFIKSNAEIIESLQKSLGLDLFNDLQDY